MTKAAALRLVVRALDDVQYGEIIIKMQVGKPVCVDKYERERWGKRVGAAFWWESLRLVGATLLGVVMGHLLSERSRATERREQRIERWNIAIAVLGCEMRENLEIARRNCRVASVDDVPYLIECWNVTKAQLLQFSSATPEVYQKISALYSQMRHANSLIEQAPRLGGEFPVRLLNEAHGLAEPIRQGLEAALPEFEKLKDVTPR